MDSKKDQIESFLKEHSLWIKKKIARNISDKYTQDEVYARFLTELVEKSKDPDVRDFIGLAKTMGSNAHLWYANKVERRYNKRMEYDAKFLEKLSVEQPLIDESYASVEKVSRLKELVKTKPGTIRVLECILANPEKRLDEVAEILGIHFNNPTMHLVRLRKLLKDNNITQDSL